MAFADYKSLSQADKLARVRSVTGANNSGVGAGMSAQAAKTGVGAALGVVPSISTPNKTGSTQGMSAGQSTGYTPPAYGSNIANFDANNQQHTALADAGQQWATAKTSGDTAGMSAAAALGQQIRSGVQGASYDSVKGVSALPMQQEVKAQALPSGGYTPPQSIMSVATVPDLQRESQANIDKQRAGLQQGVDKFISSLKAGYDYSKQGTQDNRTLEDFEKSQKVNPFSGRTGYEQGLIGRQRTIEDGATERQFNNELTSVQQQLLDFDRLAPEQQQALFQQLKRMERDYGLNLSQISGVLPDGMGQTLAAKTADQNYQLGLSGLSGQLPSSAGGGQTMQAKQFEYGKQVDQRDYDAQQAQQQWSNAFAQGQFDYQKASDAWERTFKDKSFNQSVKEAAASRGLQWANLNQNQQEFIANQAFRDKQFDYQMEQDAKSLDQNKFNQGMEAYKSTGQMPSYMSGYGIDVSGMNDSGIKEDLNAMYGQISNGTNPADLIKIIDDKVKLGLEDKSNGDKLKKSLYMLHPELDPSTPKEKQGTSVFGSKYTPSWNPFNFSGMFK